MIQLHLYEKLAIALIVLLAPIIILDYRDVIMRRVKRSEGSLAKNKRRGDL